MNKKSYLCSMNTNELQIWWSSLPIAQKERIARKGLTKETPGGKADPAAYQYPACTCWWNGLDEARKQKIHDHCVHGHGLQLQEWNDADPYGGD